MSDTVIYVRYRQGVVGESQRFVHLANASQRVENGMVTALCGLTLMLADVEMLGGTQGFPCVHCLVRSPGQARPRLMFRTSA